MGCACGSKSSVDSLSGSGGNFQLSRVDIQTYRVSYSASFVDGLYRAVNLSHYSGPMAFSREGSANFTLMRWGVKTWILFDLRCADPSLLLPGPKCDTLPAGAVKLFELRTDDAFTSPPCDRAWKKTCDAVKPQNLQSGGHLVRHAISVSRVDSSTYAVSGCPANLAYATCVNGSYQAKTLQKYSGPTAFAREGFPNLVLMRWGKTSWVLFNMVDATHLLVGPANDVLPPMAQKLYRIHTPDIYTEPPTSDVVGKWPAAGSTEWPELADARDLVQVVGSAGRGWDGTDLALLNGEYVQSTRYEVGGAFIWEQRSRGDGAGMFAFFRLEDGWWRCGRKDWARNGTKKSYVWMKDVMQASESPVFVSDLADPRWAGKWWKDAASDFPGFQVLTGAGSPSASCEVPSYWTSTTSLQIIPESPECRETISKLLNDTWRQKYTRDRGKADGDKKVASGARVLSVLRVENHRLYRKYARHREEVCRKRSGGSDAEKNPEVGTLVPRFPVLTNGVFRGEDGADHQLQEGVNEMYLFHGTSPSAADSIARNDFDMLRVGSAVGSMFGPGLYLAESASKSDEYAKEGEGIFASQYALLLCRAVAGRVYRVEDKGDKSSFVTSGDYDSVCGDREAAVGTFREMIFFNADAVYCEYIVVYSRVFE